MSTSFAVKAHQALAGSTPAGSFKKEVSLVFSNPAVSMRTYVECAWRMLKTAKRKIQATDWPDSEAKLLYDLCVFILGGIDEDHGGDRFGGYYGEKLKDTKEGRR